MTTHREVTGPVHIPGALRKRRTDARLSQVTVAQRAGCSQSYLSQLESGDRSPSLILLLRLSDALGCSVAELIPRQRAAS